MRNCIYRLNFGDTIRAIKEIQRVSKGKSFITLASYKSKKDYWMFKQWTVLGTTILLEKEWIEVLKHVVRLRRGISLIAARRRFWLR